jgi:Uma2 family endonuclease
MATVEKSADQRTAEQRFVMHGFSWQNYDHLLQALGDRSTVHVTYDRGRVELMSPSLEHEHCDHWISRLIEALSEELDLLIMGAGSTTWRRQNLDRGLEPDSCYYLTNEPLIRGRDALDLTVDPPPDLVIEVEYSRSAIDKRSIYAALGVPEMWVYDMEELHVLRLDENQKYVEQEHSEFFPHGAMEGIRQFIALRGAPHETAWIKNFRRWVRENLIK